MYDVIPHSYDAECAVIGSIIAKPELMDECFLKPEDFHDIRHITIMKYFIFLNEISTEKIDLNLIAAYAKEEGEIEKLGNIDYLVKLRDLVTYQIGIANFKDYQEMIREKAQIRKAMGIMHDKAIEGQSATKSGEYVDDAIQALEAMQEVSEEEVEIVNLGSVLDGHEEVIQKRKESLGLTGVKTCSNDLDALTGGHQKGDLIIIAARPSIGKTAFMLNDAIEGQKDAKIKNIEGSAAYIVSIEMKKIKIAERAACAIGNLDSRKLKSGELTENEWAKFGNSRRNLKELNIFIKDTSVITLQQIDRDVKKMIKKYPNMILYIDYLQLVDCGKKGIRDDPTKNSKAVSWGLKNIARKYDIPVVAISAVGRDVEKRQDKRPMLSDLRESGSIESDADIVIFLYRDDYYNASTEKKHIIELILAKGRDTGIGLVEMLYFRSTSRFINIVRQNEGGADDGKRAESNKGNE